MFSAIFFAEVLSSASLRYSSLNVKIAEGSIPIKGVSFVIRFLKKLMLKFAFSLALSKIPFEIKLRPLSSCCVIVTLYPNFVKSSIVSIPILAS